MCEIPLIKKDIHGRFLGPLQGRVGNAIIGFLKESIDFCDQKIDSIVKQIESITSIFKRDRRAKINGRNSIFWHKK